MWERGYRIPRIDSLIKLAVSLEASADELLDGIEWQPGDVRLGGFREEPVESAGFNEND